MNNDYIDDMFSTEYEEITQAAELFGVNRTFMLKLAMLREMKEFNRLFGNWSEGRKAW